MTEKPEYDNDEISLLDIYEFFRDGWKTLIGFSALGLFAGLVIAFVLPEKFQARALIEPASVGKKGKDDTITSAAVEPVAVLAEKMKVPTYYSAATIQACQLNDVANPADALVKRLGPSVARNSTYVSLSYKANSPALATACLESVLNDVAANQTALAQPMINNLKADLESTERQLLSTSAEQDFLLKRNPERLSLAKSKVASAQKFIDTFSKENTPLRSADPSFSPSAILLPALIAKNEEVKELERQIDALEITVAAKTTEKDQEVRRLKSMVSELKNALMPPNTKPATFAAPVYTPSTKVEPKRSIIILVGLVVGGFLGLALLIGTRVRNNLRKQLNAR